MDFNKLLADHQMAMMNAHRARSARDRKTYLDLADYYAERINQYRDNLDKQPFSSPAPNGRSGNCASEKNEDR